ncbi:methyl-accepting chemotaxis protein [Dictyobacter arantiisoli]|uniref:Methyl-accepting chemotaxis protein n=1 Tax=Dictyobacter arantiisoli TaxID=2014874 RepID=A0A5A5TCW8_9CHLR|nr:methyl-accepting chemotaxis protein [Dictyobacter arantiisoli]GCF09302.1 hypothetical protein KDI_28660 [Dictyobacter arantiisoli]
MFKLLSTMQISRRLLLAFLLAAVIPGIVISTLGFTFLRAQAERNQIIRINISAFKSATTAGSYLSELNSLLVTTYLEQYQSRPVLDRTPDDAKIQHIYENNRLFEATLHHFKRNYSLLTSLRMRDTLHILRTNHLDASLPLQQQQDLDQISYVLWPDYQAAQALAIAALKQKMPLARAHPLIASANSAYTILATKWDEIVNIMDQINTRMIATTPTRTNEIAFMVVMAFFGIIMLVVIIGTTTYRSIMLPLQQITLLTRRVAQGDLHARAPITAHDEISLVAASINKMLNSIMVVIEEMQTQSDVTQGHIARLVSEVRGIADGDLSIQTGVSDTSVGILADTFNYIIEELGSVVVRIKEVAHKVAISSSGVLDYLAETVDSNNIQLQQMSKASAEIETMAISSRAVTERAQVLYEVARDARQEVQRGDKATEKIVSGMERINTHVQTVCGKAQLLDEHARHIDEIIEIISGIAHQTNRLALDAAIQSAIAGESNQGFGAIASDIRRLSERTKDQATLITHLVRDICEEAGNITTAMRTIEKESHLGIRLSKEARCALEAVSGAVEQQAREIENINAMSLQQLQSSRIVIQIMQESTTSTQRNSTRTREASHTVEGLAHQVDHLRLSVEIFKLRYNQTYYVVPRTNHSKGIPLTVNDIFNPDNPILNKVPLYHGHHAPIGHPTFPASTADYARTGVPKTEQEKPDSHNNKTLS